MSTNVRCMTATKTAFAFTAIPRAVGNGGVAASLHTGYCADRFRPPPLLTVYRVTLQSVKR